MKREMTLTIDSDSANEAFARTVVAAYVTRLDPTLEELADIKTALFLVMVEERERLRSSVGSAANR